MKKLFLIVIMVVFVFTFFGCTGKSAYTPPDTCLNVDGTQKESIILERIDHPRETAVFLKLASTTIASQVTPEYIDEMISVIDTTKNMLESSNYSEVSTYLLEQISVLRSKYSTQLMIVSQYCQDLVNVELPIYECDKALLRKHLREQKELLKLQLIE